MIQLQQIAQSPADNPDEVTFKATFVGNYGLVGGVGDLLNLTPYNQTSNPTGYTDPNNLGCIGPSTPLLEPPAVVSENLGGYYCQIQPGAVPAPVQGVAGGISLTGVAVRVYAPGGNEVNQAAAYAASVLAGQITIKVKIPPR